MYLLRVYACIGLGAMLMPTAIRAVMPEQNYTMNPLGDEESPYGFVQHTWASPSIVWRVPVGCDYSGFFVEVLNFLIGLQHLSYRNNDALFLALDMGKCSEAFLDTLEPGEAELIRLLQKNYEARYGIRNPDWKNTVLIHHKLPGTPFLKFEGLNRPKLIIGRVMTESNILPKAEINFLDDVDYVWVPSEWHLALYLRHGIESSRLFVMNEPMSLLPIKNYDLEKTQVGRTESEGTTGYRFLSVFKYEHRKGPDILLKSYWKAFSATDNVELIIRSYKPSWLPGTKDLTRIFRDFAKKNFNKRLEELPKVTWIRENLSRKEMFALYKSVSSFVLPTRGEGWCLPCVEAMASGLPIIVTNYSGPLSYLNASFSYPIKVRDRLNDDGTAEPDLEESIRLMRHLYKNRREGRQKGILARNWVANNLSPDILAKKIILKIQEYLSTPL